MTRVPVCLPFGWRTPFAASRGAHQPAPMRRCSPLPRSREKGRGVRAHCHLPLRALPAFALPCPSTTRRSPSMPRVPWPEIPFPRIHPSQPGHAREPLAPGPRPLAPPPNRRQPASQRAQSSTGSTPVRPHQPNPARPVQPVSETNQPRRATLRHRPHPGHPRSSAGVRAPEHPPCADSKRGFNPPKRFHAGEPHPPASKATRCRPWPLAPGPWPPTPPPPPSPPSRRPSPSPPPG
jgi:hypothetical protein